jgi:hypothetical protein
VGITCSAINAWCSYLKLVVFQQFRRLFIAFIILPGGIEIIINMVRQSLVMPSRCSCQVHIEGVIICSLTVLQVLLWRNHLWANRLKEELEVGGLVSCIAWLFRPSVLRKIALERQPQLVRHIHSSTLRLC